MVVTEMEGVVKLVFPVSNADPPEAAAYQSMVSPAPGVAVMVTVPVPHLALLPAAGAEGIAATVAVTAVLAVEVHPVEVFLATA